MVTKTRSVGQFKETPCRYYRPPLYLSPSAVFKVKFRLGSCGIKNSITRTNGSKTLLTFYRLQFKPDLSETQAKLPGEIKGRPC